MASDTGALSEVVERALVAFSTDANYFVTIVEAGRANAQRMASTDALTYTAESTNTTITTNTTSAT